MPIEPKLPERESTVKICERCGRPQLTSDFTYTHSLFYKDHYLPICNSCINGYLEDNNYEWDKIDKLCQWADIPFIIREWERLHEISELSEVWGRYSKIFKDNCYQNLGWADYNKQYLKLREANCIDDELPLIYEQKIKDLRKKWGGNYSEEELDYLEDLYKGLLLSQNVNGALQIDQALKLCKFSLEIDSRIRSGDKDVDKFISSYDRLVKIANFTPKNAKNAVDFDSFAEVGLWLEKRGRQNKFYDGTTRDIIDESIKSIENYNQRLYINESGIGDEITKRIEALNNVAEMEHDTTFDLDINNNLDDYDNEGYSLEEENEEFDAGVI